MIKNIIFDFDGVLVDSEILIAKAFAKYIQNFGQEVDEKEFARYAGKKNSSSNRYFIKKILNSRSKKILYRRYGYRFKYL